ncbi:MAG TPA: serine/threonine-protein kinase [Kofleriaceae bacterium]|nr:serine/threonine-protein kinase [Kofleriaceae bacterium]
MTQSFAEGLVGIVLDGRYRLDALLGEGGMGAVYRAHHLAMDRRVAVKLLKPHLTQDHTALERFAREARSTQKVDSPHAVKVLDYGVTPHDDYYMVLEYLDGRTVQRELDVDGPFAPARVLHIAKHALYALGAAHRIGLVHRDIKPDNLLLMRVGDDPDFTKVLDFGVAKLMEGAAKSSRSQLSLTQAGMVFGTPEFMSPEQACGQTLDPRSDLYSLAATMFAMLTGCGMFQAGSAIEWLTAHARTPPPHLVDGNPGLAGYGELDALLQRCFAKRPDGRPADAETMIREIEAVEQRSSGAAPASRPPKLVATFSPSTFTPALPPELAGDSTLTPAVAPTPTAETKPEPQLTAAPSTGEVPVAAGHRGLWLLIGSLVIAGMIAVAIVVATAGKARRVAAARPDAALADATRIAAAPRDAAADAAPVVADAARELPHPPVVKNPKTAELEEHLANAMAAQRAGKRMTQVTQAHAAYLLDPHNVKAVLLLADGLLAEGDLEHGCKYLRELGHNPVAQQRMRSASCPSD